MDNLTTNPSSLKRCTKCKEWKPPTIEFFFTKKTISGFESFCRVCRNAQRTAHRRNPKPSSLICPDGYRCCTKCQEVKLEEMFLQDNKKKEWHPSLCRKCNHISSERRRAKRQAERTRSPERFRGYRAKWQQANPGKKRECNRAWSKNNPEKVRAKDQAYRATHPDHSRTWNAANPDKARANSNAAKHARRARKTGNGGSYTREEMRTLEQSQNGHCAYCNRMGYALHIDHIIPVAQSGPSYIWNLCLACRKCNLNKGNKTPQQWVNRWYLN